VAHVIEGYALCVRCQDSLVLEPIAKRTGGLCTGCFEERGSPLRRLDIQDRGARFSVDLNPDRRPNRKRVKSPESKTRERAVDKCKLKALRRLRAVFPDLYDIFLAEERAAIGLDPWPLGSALIHGPDPDGSQTETYARLYHALQDQGVEA
jgi:hypothetical protein